MLKKEQEVEVTATQAHLNHRGIFCPAGCKYPTPISIAFELVVKGLVEMDAVPETKMAEPDGAEVSAPAKGKKGKK